MNISMMTEDELKELSIQIRMALRRICLREGHDTKTTMTRRKEMSGSHIETVREREHYEDCFHNCHCPEVEKQRMIPDYVVCTTYTHKCERCGETTITEGKERYTKWSML